MLGVVFLNFKLDVEELEQKDKDKEEATVGWGGVGWGGIVVGMLVKLAGMHSLAVYSMAIATIRCGLPQPPQPFHLSSPPVC